MTSLPRLIKGLAQITGFLPICKGLSQSPAAPSSTGPSSHWEELGIICGSLLRNWISSVLPSYTDGKLRHRGEEGSLVFLVIRG